MRSINLYYHGGSANHGCEAIIRSTNKILKNKLTLYSSCPQEDLEYDIGNFMDIIPDNENIIQKKSLKYILSALQIKIFGSTLLNTKYRKQNMLMHVKSKDIWMSIGGDNYCYAGIEILADLNRLIKKKKAKTVLWGCSIEPSKIDKQMKKDLSRYDLIVARESLTYDALIENGINTNTVLYPDPAFQLNQNILPLPEGFKKGYTIGINISPLIVSYEKNEGQVIQNYINLVQHIIDTTDYQVALIPHVVKADNDDRIPLLEIYKKFENSHRVVMIEDHNCMDLKGFISSCKMFIGARTHATIAAYSTNVPTLVVGYSVKAKGIAKDIFGSYEKYVIPVQSIQDKNDIINAFEWLKANELSIREHLENFIPGYCQKALSAKNEIERLIR